MGRQPHHTPTFPLVVKQNFHDAIVLIMHLDVRIMINTSFGYITIDISFNQHDIKSITIIGKGSSHQAAFI